MPSNAGFAEVTLWRRCGAALLTEQINRNW